MTAQTDYISDVSKTELLRIIVALSTEVYALADRQRATEAVLTAHKIDLAPLSAPIEPAVYDEERLAERDAFVARVFGTLAGDPAEATSES
ncbi:MAG: hypothetical protein OEQ29_20785 [Alphaproteobacteria bacterium]|nr:hypothetical protein [Alphaproteobacteria bacterium]